MIDCLNPVKLPSARSKGLPHALYGMILCAVIGALMIAAPQQAYAKYAAYIYDANSGEVLYAINENTRNYPASLTKIMTLYMVFDALEANKIRLDDRVKFSRRAAGQAPSKLGVKAGKSISVQQAIMALVTKSANDVATAVAEHLGGTEIEFARKMTAKARELGMTRTSFKNASGLPNRGQLSTAKDMGVLGIRIQQDFPQYYHYFSNKSFDFAGKKYKNHNNLLGNYQGADGIKTGYTRASGFNLVASVKRNRQHVIGVVLGGKTGKIRDRHMKKLLDRGFAQLNQDNGNRFASNAQNNAQNSRGMPIPPKLPDSISMVAAVQPTTNKDQSELHMLAQGDADGTSGRAFVYDNVGRWIVQVGAFSSKNAALEASEGARRILDGKFESNRGKTAIYRPKESSIYRALLVGYSQQTARQACNQLKAKRVKCFVKEASLWLAG
ncbi:MAG: D-alanyl-D-alanine carboxypeptidase [Alphaproteobacteria bacterium]